MSSRNRKIKKENIVFYDMETTGLDASTNGTVQIAMLFEKDGEIVDTYVSNIDCSQYLRDVAISEKAMEINGYKVSDIPTFPSPQIVVDEIARKLYKVYGKGKVKLCGFNNTSFDKFFLKELYAQTTKEMDKYFHYKQLDVFEVLKGLQYLQLIEKTWNQRLVTYIEHFKLADVDEIESNAHDALWDIHMTRELMLRIPSIIGK